MHAGTFKGTFFKISACNYRARVPKPLLSLAPPSWTISRTFFMAPSSEIIKYFGWGNKTQSLAFY